MLHASLKLPGAQRASPGPCTRPEHHLPPTRHLPPSGRGDTTHAPRRRREKPRGVDSGAHRVAVGPVAAQPDDRLRATCARCNWPPPRAPRRGRDGVRPRRARPCTRRSAWTPRGSARCQRPPREGSPRWSRLQPQTRAALSDGHLPSTRATRGRSSTRARCTIATHDRLREPRGACAGVTPRDVSVRSSREVQRRDATGAVATDRLALNRRGRGAAVRAGQSRATAALPVMLQRGRPHRPSTRACCSRRRLRVAPRARVAATVRAKGPLAPACRARRPGRAGWRSGRRERRPEEHRREGVEHGRGHGSPSLRALSPAAATVTSPAD